jgi:heme oxygenase
MMADNQLLNNDGGDDGIGGGDDIFVYTGGDQHVPRDVKRVRIAENVDTIPARTFDHCRQLIEVEGHKKIKTIEEYAFFCCIRLRSVMKMRGVIEIEQNAFNSCSALSDIDFDKLEIIGHYSFAWCTSLRSVNMPSIRSVSAFCNCTALTDVVFGKDLERIEEDAFFNCTALRSISIPLKDNLIIANNSFNICTNLSRVDTLDGGIHKTISSLHLESWRDEMLQEIGRINQTLANIRAYEKARVIQPWLIRVLGRMEHYKTEHQTLLKEAMTLLELALWKAKLLNEGEEEKKCKVNVVAKKANIDAEAARRDHRVTCGANIVIKNVLPFLSLE